MIERAAVPPRTIKKLSGFFCHAIFILDFFGGRDIQSQKTSSAAPNLSLESAARISGGGGGIDFGLRPSPLRGCLRQSVTLRVARTSEMLTRPTPGASALRAQLSVDLPRDRPLAWFIIPQLMAEGVGLISASGLHPRGAAFGSL